MSHVSLDLETLGTSGTSVILSIGAVIFTGGKITGTFYRAIDVRDSLSWGLAIDADTVKWWGRQSREARAAVNPPFKCCLADVLEDFSRFFPNDAEIWGNGPSFDCGILANAYRAVDRPTPWKFWKERCLRTLDAVSHPSEHIEFIGTPHHALWDAYNQARRIMAHGVG